MKSESEIAGMALDGIGSVVNKLTSSEEKSEALGFILLTTYNLLRSMEGDEFMRGWLESALRDIEKNPPVIALSTAH